jgi:hypothetical protein
MSTLKAINFQNPSNSSVTMITSANNDVSFASNLTAAGNLTAGGTVSMSSPFTMRNRIINGAMQIWQRGTTAASGYVADRWQGVNTTTCNRSSDVPTGHQYSIEYGNTGATYPYVCQSIESVHCIDLVGQSITISFWAKNISGTATLYTEIAYANSVDNFTSPTIITNSLNSASPSSSWTYYTVTFTNLPANVANGLQLRIVRNNASAATTRITGVQLEVGSVATPFERRPYGLELALCQRYYQKIYSMVGTPGNSTTNFYCNIFYPTTMRATPTLSVSGPLNVTDPGVAGYTQSSADITVVGGQNTTGAFVRFANFSGINAYRNIMANDFSQYVIASAEL